VIPNGTKSTHLMMNVDVAVVSGMIQTNGEKH